MSPNCERFIKTARRGKHPAASGGEVAAWVCASAVVDQAARLDEQNMDGLIELVELVKSHPSEMHDALYGE